MNFEWVTRDFDDRLRLAIKMKGITQKELAARIGVSEAIVSRWVRGNRFPHAKQLFALAEALDVDAEWLTLGKERDG